MIIERDSIETDCKELADNLRKPDFDYYQFKDFIQSIDEDLHYKVVIHSHYGLANKLNLAGICLNKKALSQIAYADEVDKCFIQPLVLKNRQIEINKCLPNMITYTGHSLSEIDELPFNIEYAFLSSDFENVPVGRIASKEALRMANAKIIANEDVTFLSAEYLQSKDCYKKVLWISFE